MNDDEIRHEIRRRDELAPAFYEEIERHYAQVFSYEIHLIQEWTDADWQLVSWIGDEWVSVVELNTRTILVGGVPFRAGGVGGVYTPEAYRGKGYASASMQRAQDYLCREQSVDFALLLCGKHRISFYEGLGWLVVDNHALYHQTIGVFALPADLYRMIYSCGDHAWPQGEIDFQGPPW